jgi:pimeloyl-ACP methyl ester carboxylesterase
MTQILSRPDGHIAYDVQGDGPLVVCVPGMGDLRGQYRHVLPGLAAAGHRVATLDLRGMGDSDATFADASPEAVGADVVALIEALDGHDVTVIGNSMAAASAVWAAAEAPDRVARLVLVGPFARDVPLNPVLAWLFRAMLAGSWGRWVWTKYYPSLLKAGRPDDHAAHVKRISATLREPGRMATFRRMAGAPKAACEARIPEVKAQVLVVMGDADPDFPDPAAEAQWVAEHLHGTVSLVPGAGHYPHQEVPSAFLDLVVPFLRGEAACRASA